MEASRTVNSANETMEARIKGCDITPRDVRLPLSPSPFVLAIAFLNTP